MILTAALVLMVMQAGAQREADMNRLRKLHIALSAIEALYVDTVNSDRVVEDAIRGMLEKLDPHSSYSTPKETKEMTEPLNGSFEGIGVQFNMADDTLLVIQPVSNGPSERIGILAGEKYMEAVYVVPPVTVSLLLLFYCQLFGNYEFYYEEKKSLIWATIGAAAANFLLNWIFIGIYGYIAAAYTTLFSYIILTACHGLAMKLIMKKHQRKGPGYNYRGLLLLFFGYCGVAAAGALLYGTLLVRAAVAFLVLLILFARRKTILNLIRTLRQKDQTAGETAAAD